MVMWYKMAEPVTQVSAAPSLARKEQAAKSCGHSKKLWPLEVEGRCWAIVSKNLKPSVPHKKEPSSSNMVSEPGNGSFPSPASDESAVP